MRERGEVVDDVGPRVAHARESCVGVAQVDAPAAAARHGHHLVARRAARRHEVGAGEARGACDEHAPARWATGRRGRTTRESARPGSGPAGPEDTRCSTGPWPLDSASSWSTTAGGSLPRSAGARARRARCRRAGGATSPARTPGPTHSDGKSPPPGAGGPAPRCPATSPGARRARRGAAQVRRDRQRRRDAGVDRAQQRAVGEVERDGRPVASRRPARPAAQQLRVVVGHAEDPPVERGCAAQTAAATGSRQRPAQRPHRRGKTSPGL